MFSPLPNRRSLVSASALSVAAHAVVVAVILFSLRLHPVKVFSLPGTDLGTRVELTYLPGRAPVPTPHPQIRVKPKALSGPQIAPPRPVLAAAPDAAHLPPLPHLTVTESAPSPNAFLSRLGYSRLQQRFRFVWLGLDTDCSYHLLPQPQARSFRAPSWGSGRRDRRCHHRSQRQGRRPCRPAHPWLRH